MMRGEMSAGLKVLKCKVYLLFGGASLVSTALFSSKRYS